MNDPAPILDLIDAFRRSKTMFTAVKLGIFDGERPSGAATDRLLDACVGLGLLTKTGAEYVNTPVAEEYLTQSSPRTLTGYIRYSNDALYPMWAHLDDAVIEGTNRWTQTFGTEGGLFTQFFRTPEAQRDFLMGMNGFGMISSPAVIAAFDLSRFTSFVDLGGATGHLALAVRDRYPQMKATLFDLPSVIAVAQQFVGDRVSLVAGDFFIDELPGGDLYAVGRILHDWAEEKIVALLQRIYDALPDGGGLLIAEKLLGEDRSGTVPTLMQSLNMLVCTEGRERTLSEYSALLRGAGFREIRGQITGAPLDAVLALSDGLMIEKVSYGGWPNCYRIFNEDVELIATSDVGPRVIRCGFIGGQNLFKEFPSQLGGIGEAEWLPRGGHRIWIAPEVVADTYVPDNGPVRASMIEGGVELTQSVEPETGLEKTIAVQLSANGVTVTHRIRNAASKSRIFAPWVLTMMAPGGVGITKFPPRGTHPEVLPPTNPLIMWAFTDLSDPRWTFTKKYLVLRQDGKNASPQKLGLFNEHTVGAYLLGSDLFVKRYEADPSKTYPDFGASYETFTNEGFLELETLGPLEEVAPGAAVEHVEHWELRRGAVIGEWTDAELDRVLACPNPRTHVTGL